MERVIVVLSGKSGLGAQPFERALGAGTEVWVTEGPGDAPRLARAAVRRGATLVVAAGGDGTIQEVAAALVAHAEPPALAVVPLGTANDFARHFGLLDLDLDAQLALLDGTAVPLDVARVGEHTFVNQLTAGLGAAVTAGTPAELKDALGGFAYWVHGLSQLGELAPFGVRIRAGDAHFEGRAFGVSVGNGRYGGGGYCVHPDAVVSDGLLDIAVAVAPTDMSEAVALARDVAAGTADQVWRNAAARIEIAFEDPQPVNLDGEPIELTHATVRVQRHGLRLVLPDSDRSPPTKRQQAEHQ